MRYDATEEIVFFNRQDMDDWSALQAQNDQGGHAADPPMPFAVSHVRNHYRQNGWQIHPLADPENFIENWKNLPRKPVPSRERLQLFEDALQEAHGESALRRTAVCPELLAIRNREIFLLQTRCIGLGAETGLLADTQQLFIVLVRFFLRLETRIVAAVFEQRYDRYRPQRHTWNLRFEIDAADSLRQETPKKRVSIDFPRSVDHIAARDWEVFMGMIPRIRTTPHFGRPVENGGVGFAGSYLYPEIVHEFIQHCRSLGLVVDFEWRDWEGRTAYLKDSSQKVRRAGIATLIKLITAHIRYDEAHEGWLGHVFEEGHILEILLRFREIRPVREEA
jgi:hypothetical protein